MKRIKVVLARCVLVWVCVLSGGHGAALAQAEGSDGFEVVEGDSNGGQDDASWQKPVPFDGLYQRIAKDLKDGKPLVVASYYGMWFKNADDPENNLNWGMRYGHATLMRKSRTHKHVRKNYRHRNWQLVFEESQGSEPLRTLVFKHSGVKPNRKWKALGVTEPFDAYIVMQAFEEQKRAGIKMVENLRQDRGRTLTLDDGTVLDVGSAQVVGYFGHNFFYDFFGFGWDGLSKISGTPSRPKGLFAVGCRTGRVPGFPALIGRNVHAVLYSRSLMASEGYSTLALLDGLLRAHNSKQMANLANDTYQYFQRLPNPDRRVGRPFISHDHGLY